MKLENVSPDSPCILHLEDNPADADFVGELLKCEWPHCRIIVIESREALIRELDRAIVDLVLSDFTLPGFDGLSALEIARERFPEIPFVFLSGTIGEHNAVAALQRGAADYVIKDRPNRLIPAIKRALGQKREQLMRRRAEAESRRLAALLDRAPEAVFISDVDGRCVYCNRRALDLFGWFRDDAAHRDLLDPFRKIDPMAVDAAITHLQSHGAWQGELKLELNQAVRTFECRWTLAPEDEDAPASILHIFTDVTERKTLEAQLLRAQRLEGIGTLAGGIAHDLNNVLAPILMATNLLQREHKDPESQRFLTVIEQSTRHGAELLKQVLAFARGADGEQSKILPSLAIRDVTEILLGTLPRSISIESNVPKDLGAVLANATHLSQVLMNLAVNARDAMPSGGRLEFRGSQVQLAEADVSPHPGCAPGTYVRIDVSDTGCGMPPEILNRIFDPFFTTKRIGKGTGLGLSTAAGIVRSSKGFMSVESQPGEGTVFSIFIPVVVPDGESEKPREAPPPLPRGNGETILIVDDEKHILAVIRSMLEKAGYRVLSASCGRTAVALLREQGDEIALLLSDLMMPTMQGHDLIRIARSLQPNLPVVAMTGLQGNPDPDQKIPEGIAVLAKPMSGVELVAAVQTALKVRT